jgi:hypothetical protein
MVTPFLFFVDFGRVVVHAALRLFFAIGGFAAFAAYLPELFGVAAWYDAKTLDEEKAAVRRLNKVALENAIYAPLGMFLRHYAWRKNVSGIGHAPLPLFWGVSKTA